MHWARASRAHGVPALAGTAFLVELAQIILRGRSKLRSPAKAGTPYA